MRHVGTVYVIIITIDNITESALGWMSRASMLAKGYGITTVEGYGTKKT